MSIEAVLTHIDRDQDQALDRLFELLKIESISTDPDYAEACDQCADFLVQDLASMGFEATKRPTPGHPMVVGHRKGKPGASHVIFYGHYDVQPVDPLELWDTPPFEPALQDTPKGKVIRGRGTSDDKGQLMTFVEACRAWIAVHGELPINVTLFFEGEEESGSPSLIPFMKENADELKADVALICDTGMVGPNTPSIVTMLRGLAGEEITIKGPDRDLHSGMYGGPSINPIKVLSRIIAGLHDDQGRVTLPGFYDGVEELPEEISAQWKAIGFDDQTFLGEVGLNTPAGEQGHTVLEQLWARPTCEVNGIWGGYTGAGFKTVLPAEAHAKISFRLVGKQDPFQVINALHDHVKAHLPPDCSAEFNGHGRSPAATMDLSKPAFEQARQALTQEWPEAAAYVGCGGSIPIAGYFQELTDTPAMLIGFAQDDDAIHSPNEKYDLRSFHKGIRSWARIIDAFA